MHVAIASHYRLPVAGYGGTERVVVALVRGLAALGHRVTLIAAPGTQVPEAALVAVSPDDLTSAPDLARFAPADADLMHAFFPVYRLPSCPFLQTLSGHLRAGAAVPPHNVFLSHDHARRYGSEAFVYNGLDPADFVFQDHKADYDLFLGRLHSAKGYRLAIEGAKRSRRRLILAGGWRPSLSRRIRFVGEVGGRRKMELLAGARCLWVPAQWPEPFGLTTIEALFSGTPVIASPHGALPEVVAPDVGFLCEGLDEMVEAAQVMHTFDPATCRAYAERYFSHTAMAEEYLRVYGALLETGTLPPGRPTPHFLAQHHAD